MRVAANYNDCPNFYIANSIGFSEVSEELARWLETKIHEKYMDASRSYSLKVTEDLLHDIYAECSQNDWDGYGASSVTKEAINEALKFINSLPSYSIPMPEISAHPNGEVGLEWRKEKRMVFVVSLGGKHKINYAGILGENKTHGSEYFGESIPSIIIENLRRLYHQ